MKVLLVTGTRTEERRGEVSEFLNEAKPDLVIVGCARGVDAEARTWCQEHGVDMLVGVALWGAHGKAAGHRRNTTMVRAAKAFESTGNSVSFVAFPVAGSRGTRHCVDACKRAGLCGVVL